VARHGGRAALGGSHAGVIKRITLGRAEPDPAALRSVVCTVLPELTTDALADVVTIDWLASGHAGVRIPDADVTRTVLAEEIVLRGADWLEARWRDGGERFKHVAFARRADGLTPAQFAERWRSHAGSLGGVPIPDEAKGRAYAQNHPLPRDVGEWPFDAVNEVWFDDLEGLRRRVEWFSEHHDPSGDDLFGPSRFLAVREVLVSGR
jgi:hypothetical protein